MRIGITGVPGSGKTTLAKDLAQVYNIPYISINEIAMRYGLGDEVDVTRLQRVVDRSLDGMDSFVIEGHLLVELDIRLDVMILLRASYRALLRRYRKRGYPDWKVWENIAAEVLDYFPLSLDDKRYIEIDTTGLSRRMLLRKTLRYIERGQGDSVDWKEDMVILIRKGMI